MEPSDELPAQLLAALLGSTCNVEMGMVVGLSGGIDSIVLLDCLHKISQDRALPLVAVHVDHGLRKNSHLDATFCARFARERNIAFRVKEVNIPTGSSIQARARVARYSALSTVLRETRMGAVCTAHHRGDAIETALINLTRGTGVSGLVSLRPLRQLQEFGCEVVRPMLGIDRNDVEAYATRWNLPFREDPTNADLRHLRNSIRHHVVPTLRKSAHGTNGIETSLRALRMDADALEQITDSAWEVAVRHSLNGRSVHIHRALLCEFPDAIVSRILQRSARSIGAAWSASTLALAIAEIRSAGNNRICIRSGVVEISEQEINLEFTSQRGTISLDARSPHPIEVLVGNHGRIPWFDQTVSWEPLPAGDFNPDPSRCCVCFIGDGKYFIGGPSVSDVFSAPNQAPRRVRTILKRRQIPDHQIWRWPCLFWESSDRSSRTCQWIFGCRDSALRVKKETRVRSENQAILSIDGENANN
jgi:tRNA(Ile)-lysidine synthetase-like protein